MSFLCIAISFLCANLLVAAIHSAFDPPEGKTAFDYVFDFTGEVRNDRSETVGTSLNVHILTNSSQLDTNQHHLCRRSIVSLGGFKT